MKIKSYSKSKSRAPITLTLDSLESGTSYYTLSTNKRSASNQSKELLFSKSSSRTDKSITEDSINSKDSKSKLSVINSNDSSNNKSNTIKESKMFITLKLTNK